MRHDASDLLYPGQIFSWKHYPSLLRPRIGLAQVLSVEPEGEIVHLSILKERSELLEPLVGFMPILVSAFGRSSPALVKRAPIVSAWEHAHAHWAKERSLDIAGAFSLTIREALVAILKTVKHFREVTPRDSAFVEWAYPARDEAKRFTLIRAAIAHTGATGEA